MKRTKKASKQCVRLTVASDETLRFYDVKLPKASGARLQQAIHPAAEAFARELNSQLEKAKVVRRRETAT